METVSWVAGFDLPDFTVDHELLALSQPGTYPIELGTVVTSAGRSFTAAEFEENVVEQQVPHSTALQARLSGQDGTYLTGSLARYTLSAACLPALAAAAAAEAGLGGQLPQSLPQHRGAGCRSCLRA
jgi:sulfhydrogenase subunit alpha